jgi:hypothetical protein
MRKPGDVVTAVKIGAGCPMGSERPSSAKGGSERLFQSQRFARVQLMDVAMTADPYLLRSPGLPHDSVASSRASLLRLRRSLHLWMGRC